MYEILTERAQKVKKEHQWITASILLETAPNSTNSVQTVNTPKQLAYPYGASNNGRNKP